MLEERVPNCGIKSNTHDRRGRECIIPQLKGKSSIRNLRDQSFQVNGPRLFNSLPKQLRNLSKVPIDEFKMKPDKYLANLPDNPKIGDLVPSICNQITAKPSNSLIDVIQHQKNIYLYFCSTIFLLETRGLKFINDKDRNKCQTVCILYCKL